MTKNLLKSQGGSGACMGPLSFHICGRTLCLGNTLNPKPDVCRRLRSQRVVPRILLLASRVRNRQTTTQNCSTPCQNRENYEPQPYKPQAVLIKGSRVVPEKVSPIWPQFNISPLRSLKRIPIHTGTTLGVQA